MEKLMMEDFRWFTPQPKNRRALSIPRKGMMYLSSQFMKEGPRHVTFGVDDKRHRVGIRETEDAGYSLPKSGKIRDPELEKALMSGGIRYPARFTLHQAEGGWIGELDEQAPPALDMKTPAKKAKRISLNSLDQELEARDAK